jgi:hypothetical protein
VWRVNDGQHVFGAIQHRTEVLDETFLGQGAETLEQMPMAEMGRSNLGMARDVMAVQDGSQHLVQDEAGGGLHVFLVAGGTEPATFAREGKHVFVRAMVAADAGKAAFEGFASHSLAAISRYPITNLPPTTDPFLPPEGRHGERVARSQNTMISSPELCMERPLLFERRLGLVSRLVGPDRVLQSLKGILAMSLSGPQRTALREADPASWRPLAHFSKAEEELAIVDAKC